MEITADDISHPLGAGVTTQLRDIRKELPLRVLSEEDWQHWITKGYVIVRGAVPRENCDRLAALLWEFDEKDPDDPSTWYAPERRPHVRAELNNAGMVEIYHHQYLWDNRMEPRVYDAFVDIWDREDLWVAIDRANLNVPRKDRSGSPDGFIHWDVNTSLDPPPIGVQGVLSLLPQDGETGGFQCVPYLFEHFADWVKTQPADRNPLLPDMTGLERENIVMEPGDLMIFNSLLAHGVRPNLSEGRVRMAQYISMQPADQENAAEREERIRLWREIEPPNRPDFPGDPRDWEKRHNGGPADLSPLGRKLLGLDRW
ncbi:phytanoyl-CoA dioxygenase family protein [Ponticoccus sp. SC2-23]|uniref:phytanoyl-CoA dioxygenase family protein n=1 Tax=Alexandriicola marinus TaxID=2081710 RepID=UPI000FDC1C08|nr:phytanoyl-CoA dioxygenase family protein [Alexandriicola marinus]MBM1219262.1 phytanoyl-CoA dioxygenase family protein [Ponticoccus sp. SC6-9]MBM1223666.1 phytanoyl-CoA dioxygenase family protein [Ponticoccus sp. SC6-15]MBM1229075.1 phytanoyl-CoA dioxygenase family protein [Ponticoccus sp. SC6-38]MBM1232632.1 phytanoyl-CoA dioxygenase family protein [Ponticoccus sp. SC6-45]MBM1237418.1 phytanoyl-CoA dioxygenase family protein [Ponticoccus sp. SC6-49]MBM1241643.1 phytanoyl-CoA dioxygenase f